MLYGKNRRRPASVLIELLLSAFIIAGVFPAAVTLLKQTADGILRLYDHRVAIQRIASAESLLDYPICYCGYAMPADAEEYQKAFNYQQYEPFSWNGPIGVASRNGKDNALLKIAYGKRENALVATELHYSAATRTLQLNNKVAADNITAAYSDFPSKVQNYILLSSMSVQPVPLAVRYISGNTLLLGKTVYSDFTVSMNDPLFLFCAMKIYADNNILYSKDYRTAGVVPRVDGVADIRFFPDTEHDCITVYTLVCGSVKFGGKKQLQLTNFAKDETNYRLISEWEKLSSAYKLYASKKTWGLPNCIKQSSYIPNSAD